MQKILLYHTLSTQSVLHESLFRLSREKIKIEKQGNNLIKLRHKWIIKVIENVDNVFSGEYFE